MTSSTRGSGSRDTVAAKATVLAPANAVEERALMIKHPEIGSEILRRIDFLDEAKLVVRHHHERWDGSGYPDALAGESIPVAARVFAVYDTIPDEAFARLRDAVR